MRILPIYCSALIEPELPNISASLLTLSKSISICAKVECNSVCTEPAPRASIFVFNAVTCVLIFSISKPKSPLLTLLLNVWIILLLVSSNLLSKTLSLFSASPAVCFSVFSCEADNFPSKPFLRKLYCFRRFSNWEESSVIWFAFELASNPRIFISKESICFAVFSNSLNLPFVTSALSCATFCCAFCSAFNALNSALTVDKVLRYSLNDFLSPTLSNCSRKSLILIENLLESIPAALIFASNSLNAWFSLSLITLIGFAASWFAEYSAFWNWVAKSLTRWIEASTSDFNVANVCSSALFNAAIRASTCW